MILKVATDGAAFLAVSALSLACVVQSTSGTTQQDYLDAPTTVGYPRSIDPMLVEVDTGKTMTAQPGDGVGVFIEYAGGGKWHIFWTCDTNQTRQSCNFNVKLSAETSSISRSQTEAFGAGDALVSVSPKQIVAATRTTTQASGVTFETEAGATVLVDASVSGLEDSRFLFFVQDGAVNGGFSGLLTTPLLVRGKTP
jgi:hypothetical protein